VTCVRCGGDVAPALLACPSCHALVHADRLRELAADAEAATGRGDRAAAIEHWRAALALLPDAARQHAAISARLDDLSREETRPSAWRRAGAAGGAIGGAALVLWKLKAIVLVVLTKGKLLVLGLTNATTLFSMLAAFGVYWTAFGWTFALGLIGSVYVHEIGHVAALGQAGIQATAPMFVPGVGAFVRLRGRVLSPIVDARVGLAGPLWGTGAALAAHLIALAGGGPFWSATAHVGAWLNLFNLLPVWQLDGSRAFHAMSRSERIFIAVVFGAAFFVARDGLLILLAAVSAVRAFGRDVRPDGDRTGTVRFAAVVVALAVMCRPVPGSVL